MYKRQVISPTERVKSVADKEDPRFAAARKKADKEDRRRDARDRKVGQADDVDGDDTTEDDEVDEQAKQTFSFNRPTEDDQ